MNAYNPAESGFVFLRRACGIAAPLLLLVLSTVGAFAGGGDLYISDPVAGLITEATATNNGSTSGDFVTGLKSPGGMTFDKAGNLYVNASASGTILKISPSGISPSTYVSDTGHLNGMAFDANGNLFVADYDAGTIEYFSPTKTKTNYTFGLNQPAGLAFDNSGNLYVTEHGAGVVSKYNTSGSKSTFASGLNFPTGIAIDKIHDAFYVVEENGALYKFSSSGAKLATIATGFGKATGLALDPAGNLYVAENAKSGFSGGVTEKITPTGARTVFTASNQSVQGLAVAPKGRLLNISTRLGVQTGDKVLIAGFITNGSKSMIIRGLGPSLSNFGVTSPLQDPTLELDSGGTQITANDNWKDGAQSYIQSKGLAPSDDRESVIAVSVGGSCTAIERGKNNTTGVALLEIYDLDPTANNEFLNISTRGFVGTGNDVLIGGFIVGDGQVTVVVRGIGPSLANAGVSGALQDPTLTVRDVNGTTLAFDDDWKQHQAAAIQATGLAPTNDREAAALLNLAAGNYTAVVSGVGNTTGIGLVEVYKIN